MKTTGFIARRYLFSKKHVSLISTLTMISVTGVTIGIALLIVVLSVFNGFFDVIQGFILKSDPDIRIESTEAESFLVTDELKQKLAGIPEIQATASYVSGRALLAFKYSDNKVVQVKGINIDEHIRINPLDKSLTLGSLNLGVQNGKPGLIASEELMSKLGLNVGDQVVLLSAAGMRKSLTQFSLPRRYRFEVRGTFSRFEITPGPAALIDKVAAQRLFELRNRVSGIDIRLKNTQQADDVKNKLQQVLSDEYTISTWYDLQQALYDIMYLEKWASYLILMIIVIVAVLNIIGSLSMIVIQKKRDIGVLLTMGLTPSAIKTIFVKQGLYIGLIGCVIGGGVGLFVSWLQKEYDLIKLSSAFIIDAYPVSISFSDVAIVLAGSLLLCLLASWYPARQAAKVEPADAVRYD
ncbi:MAG TPA: FtsX-like permease family protein [Balneolaceae bacterium]|nr:FtsX-like permease family protein [Balneolaceae bacterium]